MDALTFFFGLLFLVPASLHDFKTREVPDLLSYGFILFAVAYRLGQGVLLASWVPVWQLLAGFGAMLLLGFLLYYTGQWGGADSKLLFALGALLGLGWGTFDILFFLLLMLFSGALYGLLYTGVLALRNRKVVHARLKELIRKPAIHRLRTVVIVLCFLLLATILFVSKQSQLFFLLLVVLIYGLFYLWLLIKAVEEKVLIKLYPVGKLTEGDWIEKEVKVKGRVIVGPKSLGISQEQIALLRKAKVKDVWVKEGIPFIPSFLLGYILLWLLQGWIAAVLTVF